MAASSEYFRKRLQGILSASWTAQACSVFAALGLADQLAAGPQTPAELAEAVGAAGVAGAAGAAGAAGLDLVALRRLLAALADAGVLRQTGADQFELSQVGEYLRSEVPGSLRASAVLYGEEVHQAFGGLLSTIRTGRPAFNDQFGQPFYAYLGENPDFAATFNAAMSAAPAPPPLTDDIFAGARTVVDVGGGDGGLLAELLAGRPQLHGVLVELPEAAERARGLLAGAGVLSRVRIAAGSFFDDVPAGGDLYVLRRVLHNWNDLNACRVLERVRAAMSAEARLVVIEDLLPDGPDAPSAGVWGAPRGRIVDLLMLVLMEGRDRTAQEYVTLLADSGFVVKSITTGAIEAALA
jgi:hypothetical protein